MKVNDFLPKGFVNIPPEKRSEYLQKFVSQLVTLATSADFWRVFIPGFSSIAAISLVAGIGSGVVFRFWAFQVWGGIAAVLWLVDYHQSQSRQQAMQQEAFYRQKFHQEYRISDRLTQLEQEKAQLQQEQELHRSEIQTNQQSLEDYRKQLEDERQRLIKEEQEAQERLYQMEAESIQRQHEQTQQAEALLEQQRQEMIEALKQQEEHINEEVNTRLNMYRNEAENWRQRYQQAVGIKFPKAADGEAGWIASQLQAALMHYKIYLDFDEAYWRPEDGYSLVVILKINSAHPDVSYSQIKRAAEDVQMHIGYGIPTISLEDAVVVFTFPAQPDKRKPKKSSKDIPITEPEPEKLERAIADAYHYFVNGGTGTGKSVLICNLVDYKRWQFGDQCDTFLGDPKYPDSTWNIPITHKGFEETLQLVQKMAEDVEEALEAAREAADNNRPLPKRTPTIYVFDEAERLVGRYKTKASQPLLMGLGVGRSTKKMACYAGQAPRVSRYGMLESDLNNSTCFWLNMNALIGIEQIDLPSNLKRKFRQEIYARLALVDEQLALGIDPPPAKFFALVKPATGMPFLTTLPPENYFLSRLESEAIADDDNDQSSPPQLLGFSGDNVHQLIRAAKEGADIAKPPLPAHLKIVLQFAQSQGSRGVTPSAITKNFSTKTLWSQVNRGEKRSETVARWFAELEEQKLGKVRSEGKTIRFFANEYS